MKALLQYVVLVGIPVLGVLGILQLGQGLAAPRAVSGIWQVTPSVSSLTPSVQLSCPAAFGVVEKPKLVIEQSGPRLVFDLNDLTVHGLIEGQTVQAASDQMDLMAQLESTGMLRGTFSFPACPNAPSIAFTAMSDGAS